MDCQKRESTASRSRIAIRQLTLTLHELTDPSGGARITLRQKEGFKSRSNMRLALLIMVVLGVIVCISLAQRARVQAGFRASVGPISATAALPVAQQTCSAP